MILSALILLAACGGKSDQASGAEQSKVEQTDPQVPRTLSDTVLEEQLRQASLQGATRMVEDLISQGVRVDAMDPDGHSALMLAAFNGHTAIVKSLLEAGSAVDLRDLMDRTALLYAATGPFTETVRILLDHGAEINIVDSNEHFSPLMHAAAEGHLEVVKLLLSRGADPRLTDVDGDNAAFFARQAGHAEVADFIIKYESN